MIDINIANIDFTADYVRLCPIRVYFNYCRRLPATYISGAADKETPLEVIDKAKKGEPVRQHGRRPEPESDSRLSTGF